MGQTSQETAKSRTASAAQEASKKPMQGKTQSFSLGSQLADAAARVRARIG